MAIFDNLTPEARLMMGAGIMGGQNLGQGLMNGAQMAMPMMLANKQATAEQAVENKTRQWLQSQFPGEDFNTMSPDMMKMYVNEAFKKRFATPTNEFKVLPDGTYGTWDGQKFNTLGQATKPEEQPAIAKEFNWAKENGFKGTPQEYQMWKANLSKQKGMIIESTPDGGFRMVQGDVDTTKMPKLTEAEGKNAGFYLRAKEANDLLTSVKPAKPGEEQIPALENEGTSERNRFADNVPVVGNYIRSSEGQKYQQAKDNFITAVLRKESGAVIGETEYAREDRKYFPQPNDGPDVIEQKRRAREAAIEGLKIGAGPAADKLDSGATDDPMGLR